MYLLNKIGERLVIVEAPRVTAVLVRYQALLADTAQDIGRPPDGSVS